MLVGEKQIATQPRASAREDEAALEKAAEGLPVGVEHRVKPELIINESPGLACPGDVDDPGASPPRARRA
jgi:hypothetical protein